jgi:nitrite reductase/ring-hydroxylating ferredoxin subunit
MSCRMGRVFPCQRCPLGGLSEVLVKAQSTKCPNCKNPLTWQSHVKRWEKARQVEEFTFLCGSCNREYLFKDDKITEKRQSRDPFAEELAIQNGQFLDATNRRCPHCGGPITNPYASTLRCEWCRQEYALNEGQLQPKSTDPPQHKASLREFYAIHP